LLMPVPEAKQFNTDEAKTQSIVCNTLFLENQGFLDEQDSPKKVSNAIKTFLTFYTKGPRQMKPLPLQIKQRSCDGSSFPPQKHASTSNA
ncbi:hypothetical protein E4U32_006217, partial [Claviceps aff. humidiphila group G2b]